MKKKGSRLSALLLSLVLVLMPAAQVFADDPEPEPEPEPEPVVYQLTGTVYQYKYSASQTSGTAKSDQEVTITLKEGSTTVTTDSDGNFSYTFTEDSQRTDDGKYSWTVVKDEDHYDAEGTIEEGTETEPKENKLYIRERYIPRSTDYQFVESDKLKILGTKVWVKEPGTYTIKGAASNLLTRLLDGEASSTLSVTVNAAGAVEDFFIYVGNLCSKILTGQTVNVDHGAPEITDVTTSPANKNTFVKEHGIYGRQKAELVLDAEIDEESAVNSVYLIRQKGEEVVRYDATKITGKDGSYNATIGLPDDETILDAQLVKLVAEDIFGNKSNEVLLAESEEGSSVTLEQIPPTLDIGISGKPSAYGWYSALPTLTATASDNLSGLVSLMVTGQNKTIARGYYEDKTRAAHSISGKMEIEDLSDDGSYIYTAEATDNSGNVASKEYNIKVDLVAPKISADGVTNGEHYRENPTITIKETEKYYNASGNRIFVKVEHDGAPSYNTTYEKKNSASIDKSVFSKDGEYKVTIYAMDAADNESNTVTLNFTKDATAPKVSISGVSEGKFYNKKQTVSVKVKERFYSTDKVTVNVRRKLGGSTKGLSFPWKNKDFESVNYKTLSETGTYTITAHAIDKAGNQSSTKKVSFTIDTKPPEITISGVSDNGVYKYGQGVNPKVTVTDDYLASKSITYTKAGQTVSNPNFDQIKENDGLYTMTVSATDKAGNSTRKQISFTLNRFGSYFTYNDSIKNIMGKAVKNVGEDLVITEKNVSKVTASDAKIYRDGSVIDAKGKTTADESGAEKVYKHVFSSSNFETEGAYEITVVSKDEVGNEMESKEENGPIRFFVDRTPPSLSLSGIDPDGNKAESIDVEVSASDLLTGVTDIKATINGEEVHISENGEGSYSFTVPEGMRQEIKVSATDGAGNEAEVNKTASVSSSALSLFLNRFGIAVGAAAAAVLGGLIFLIVRKKKNKPNNVPSGEDND